MFVLRNVGKLIFGSSNQTSLIELPQGQLYLVRPQSPKGYSELIFKDATIRIRKTNQDFHYQIVVQRVYEEGEAELLAEEEGDEAEIDSVTAERDEKSFLLDESLRLRVESRATDPHERIIAWRDLSGDTGDVYEFVCDPSLSDAQIDQFSTLARKCQYERVYKKPHTTASPADLAQFNFDDDDQPIPPPSPIRHPIATGRSSTSSYYEHPLDHSSAMAPTTRSGKTVGPTVITNTSPKRTSKSVKPKSASPSPSPSPSPPPSSAAHRFKEEDEFEDAKEVSRQDDVDNDVEEEEEADDFGDSPTMEDIIAAEKEIAARQAEAQHHAADDREEAAQETVHDAHDRTRPPQAAQQPDTLETYATERAELHFFDFTSGAFTLQEGDVSATVTEVGKWQYWLQIESGDKSWLGIPIVADINPVFNFEFLSFIFNQFAPDGSAYSWLLRFRDQATLERFQEALLRALWEQLNELKWEKVKEKDRDYVTEAFNDLALEDQEQDAEDEQMEEEEEEDEEEESGPRKERYDVDEEQDDSPEQEEDGNINSQLAVGYKHDRSFVVRGSKIGVFKHGAGNHLEFSTTISRVETPDGTLFAPKKVMLHNEDRNMILQHETDRNKLYRMDLEYGKVVDEWKVHDDIPVSTFAPEKKFSQMTGEQTFLGISHNALYRVDPRLSGSKLVDSQLKQYASKNDFSALATTEKGHIAVASNKGDIRLFDRLGINAKTHIPALGEPIIGMDVSADGRYILATCRTYLLLIDAMQKSGKNEGKLGFERSFAADSKPQPRRLALTPEHVAQFAFETGKGVSFTPARFNTGTSAEEKSIITATGPYIIEWDLKKLLRGSKVPYLIKRYNEEVKADDFKYGSDSNVIVALPNEVNMIGKRALKRPTRESIAGDFFQLTGQRRSLGDDQRLGGKDSGRYKLGLDDIVEQY